MDFRPAAAARRLQFAVAAMPWRRRRRRTMFLRRPRGVTLVFLGLFAHLRRPAAAAAAASMVGCALLTLAAALVAPDPKAETFSLVRSSDPKRCAAAAAAEALKAF